MHQLRTVRFLLVILIFSLAQFGCSSTATQQSSEFATEKPGGHASSGDYPNLFNLIGVTKEQALQRLESDYQQFFYGNDEQRVYYQDGKNQHGSKAYILDVNSQDVRSEGMSYGMMIAVQMNKKQEFDAMWNWALAHMYHKNPQHPAYGYFTWSLKPNGKAIDEMPAPDGEEYFATALYFAEARWGNGEGIYNYRKYADKILTDMIHRPVITGIANGKEMTAGDMFSIEHHMVRFTPHKGNSEHTDASYHLPAFYEIWARIGPEKDRAFWQKAAQVSRDYFVRTSHPVTALTPDYGEFDGSPWAASWRKESVDFRYDAWRTAMNWSMDWNWWGIDSRQVELSNKIHAFFEEQGIADYPSLYTLDGKPLGGGHTTALVATNAAASLAASHPRKEKFIRELWDSQLPTGQFRYYDGMLYLFGLLNLSGEYKDWTTEVAIKP